MMLLLQTPILACPNCSSSHDPNPLTRLFKSPILPCAKPPPSPAPNRAPNPHLRAPSKLQRAQRARIPLHDILSLTLSTLHPWWWWCCGCM